MWDCWINNKTKKYIVLILSTAKTKHCQGCLRVWSVGHQVRGHPCKLGNFTMQIFFSLQNFSFSVVFTSKRGLIESTIPPPPLNIGVKITPSNVRLM